MNKKETTLISEDGILNENKQNYRNNKNKKDEVKLQQILKDIELIKKAIEKNNNIMKLLPFADIMRFVFLLGGIFVLTISTSFYCLIQHYGSYTDIPFVFKALLYSICIISMGCIGAVKSSRILKAVRDDGYSITYIGLIKVVYSRQFSAGIFQFFLVVVVVIVFLATQSYLAYIVSFLAIWYALAYKSLGQLLGVDDSFIISEWLLITGLTSLFFMHRIHPLIVLNITFGVGMIVTACVNYIFRAKKEV